MEDVENFIGQINSRYREGGKGGAIWSNELAYDSSIETLEPVYYWILDFIGKAYDKVKIADNFTSAPGSSYFADLSSRATRMQEEGMKILGAVNIVIKSLINILYDLKEFDIRLEAYKRALEGKTKEDRESGMLALKDIWMSNVDIKRGRGSINQMTYELGFSTLRDAFMKASSPEDVSKMGKEGLINERVVRILKPRVSEFFDWKKLSYEELRRRFNIENAYLKSQVDTLKLYSSWVKPYLKSAEQLRMKDTKGLGPPELISAFGTMTLNLSLMLTKSISIDDEVDNKNLPASFKKVKLRKLYKTIFIDYTFRNYPTQQFPHAGRVDIKFSAYALNEDELALVKDRIEQEQESSLLGIAGNLSETSIKEIQEEIDKYSKPKKKEETKEKSIFSGMMTDFMRTISPAKDKKELIKEYLKMKEDADESKLNLMQMQELKDEIKKLSDKQKNDKKLAILKEKGVMPDTYEEGVAREVAEVDASRYAFDIYDKFKKSRGMAAPPSPFDEPDVYQHLRERRAEIQAALKK
jgi:hypothetical protein